jgi:hypothetical protein
MCGDEPVLKVLVEETAETPDCYWAWWDEKDKEFQFTANFKDAVEICFPYGTKTEEKRGNGQLLPVKITIIETSTT